MKKYANVKILFKLVQFNVNNNSSVLQTTDVQVSLTENETLKVTPFLRFQFT